MTHQVYENRQDGSRRRYDDMGFIRKNWQIIMAVVLFVSGYSVLTTSVRSHHDVDDKRDGTMQIEVNQSKQDIAALREAVKAIPRIEDKIDAIYTMLNRLPARIERNR
jgi:hypothetical protein